MNGASEVSSSFGKGRQRNKRSFQPLISLTIFLMVLFVKSGQGFTSSPRPSFLSSQRTASYMTSQLDSSSLFREEVPPKKTAKKIESPVDVSSPVVEEFQPFLEPKSPTGDMEKLEKNEPAVLKDRNGQVFVVEGVVRVAKEGLKAHHVKPEARGYYNDANQFVASQELNHLALPMGLRGTVLRVFNTKVISANHPIKVQFEPDTHLEEGVNAPDTFTMHFSSNEVECV